MRIEDRGSRVEYSRCLPSPLTFAPRSSHLAPRGGLTLIELLITITILATLAAMFLGASNAAMESARSARTKTTISKIHSLLMERLDSYTTRRVDVNPTVESDIKSTVPPNLHGNAMADARLLARRELMKLEMPDRWSDAVSINSNPAVSTISLAVFLQNTPSIAQSYFRRYQQAYSASGKDPDDTNGSAECLYLTVMLFTGDGEARTLFSRQDIGDTDGDGALEFLDGWGRPIRWVRWPAGFVGRSDLMAGDPDIDHDPLDPFRRNSTKATPDANPFPSAVRPYIEHLRGTSSKSPPAGFTIGFRTVPLVFSMGPDGIGDVSTRRGEIADPGGDILLDPYAWDTTYKTYEFGSYGDNPDPALENGEDNSIDNIHNHLQDGR